MAEFRHGREIRGCSDEAFEALDAIADEVMYIEASEDERAGYTAMLKKAPRRVAAIFYDLAKKRDEERVAANDEPEPSSTGDAP